jgi:hypothetical protein
MAKIRGLILLAAVTAALCSGAFGASSSFLGGAFSDNGIGARPIGLAGAYTAVANDGNASWWNPAALAFLDKKKSATFTYVPSLFSLNTGGVSNFFGAYSQGDTSGFGGLGASINYMSANFGSDFSGDPDNAWSELTALVSWGMQVSQYFGWAKYKYPKLSIGVNAKYLGLNSDLKVDGQSVNASGFAMDLSADLALKDNLNIAITGKNVLSSLTWSNGTAEQVPYLVNVGLCYGITSDFFISGEVRTEETSIGAAAVDLFSAGTEYGIAFDHNSQIQRCALRGGLSINPMDNYYILGVGASVYLESFSVDYAYQYYMKVQLDSTHRFGVSFEF